MSFKEFKLALLLLGYAPNTDTNNRYRWQCDHTHHIYITTVGVIGIASNNHILGGSCYNYEEIIERIVKYNEGERTKTSTTYTRIR
jgi:hypothetical protein